MENHRLNEVEAICPECGQAFKAYMDRVLQPDGSSGEIDRIECPACGCSTCTIHS